MAFKSAAVKNAYYRRRYQANKEYHRKHYRLNCVAIRAKARARYAAYTPDEIAKVRSGQRDWELRNAEHCRKTRRIGRLRRRYGMTLEAYDAMLNQQNGRCASCGRSPSKRNGRRAELHIDHCHKTNIVRGILCFHCNSGIGFFFDNPTKLRAAARYLERVYARSHRQ